MPSLGILIAQGGGPTAVINQSLAGLSCFRKPITVCAIEPRYTGARHGVARDPERGSAGPVEAKTAANLEAVARNAPARPLGSHGGNKAGPSLLPGDP